MIIHPTGTCFEDVTWEFAQRCRDDKSLMARGAKFFMVHGICVMPNGKRYAHAWIEEGVFVWGPAIVEGHKGFFQTTDKEFREHYQVQECTRYSFQDLIDLSKRIGNAPPPWEDKYRRLCRGGGG